MALFDYFPYTNLHELNLDWIVRAIKSFIGEADKHFDSIDEEVKYLKENFIALKKYVNNYFDSLDLVNVVSDKLEEMLDDGTIQALLSRAIPEVASLTGDYIGKPVLRHRINRFSSPESVSGASYFFQNMTINGNYAYIIRSKSDESETYLTTYNLSNNTMLNETLIENYPHGGTLCIKDNILYSLCLKNQNLFTWDLTNPSLPALIGYTTISLPEGAQIVGWTGANWIVKTGYSFYSCDSQFNNPSLLYTIEYSGTMQDICLDPDTLLIYILTFKPETIQVYDSLDGSLYTTMNIPNIINYVSVSEPEGIHVEDGNIYMMAGNPCGMNGSLKSEMVTFQMELRNKIDHKAIYNNASLREIRVNYNMSALDFAYEGNVAIVKYIEDAQNISKECNATQITLINNYPESFLIFANSDYDFNNYQVGAFKVQEFVNCRIENFTKFTGNYIRFNNVSSQAQVYISYNAYVTFKNVPTTSVEEGKYRIWCNRGTINIEEPEIGDNIFNSAILVKSRLITSGLVGNYVMATKSVIICKAVLRTASYNNQFFSKDTTIKGTLRRGATGDRFNLNTLNGVTYPMQMVIVPNEATNSVVGAICDVPIYSGSDSPSTVSLTFYNISTNAWSNIPITITRTTHEIAAGVISESEGFTYYTYEVSYDQTIPSIYCIAILD